MKTFFIKTLGCKVNQVGSAFIKEQLIKNGYFPEEEKKAELLILNTCAVTHKAVSECNKIIKKWKKFNAKYLIVTGCYPQVYADSIVDLAQKYNINNIVILGQKEKFFIPEILNSLDNLFQKKVPLVIINKYQDVCENLVLENFPNYSRAFVKVQDGCDNFCTYCIVPFARGKPRSIKPEIVLEQIKRFVKANYNEIVITGIHIGKWGRDLSPRKELVDLLIEIEKYLEALQKPFHIRLSSIEVNEINERFLNFLKSSKFIVPHFHIPLQSGSNKILKLMGRGYTREQYLHTLEKLYKIFPDATFGADVIVGFPTESDKDFESTLYVVQNSPLNWLHIFTFSPRPGTKAYNLKPYVPQNIIRERYEILKNMFLEKRKSFLKTQQDKIVTAIVEKIIDGKIKALSSNYIPIWIEGFPEFLYIEEKSLIKVRLARIKEDLSMEGVII